MKLNINLFCIVLYLFCSSALLADAEKEEAPNNELERTILFRENGLLKDHFFGYTPLILASRKGNVKKVTKLLSKNEKVNVNWQMEWGLTALMWAANNGHEEVVALLLKKGADPNLKTIEGLTALALAKRENHKEIINVLISNGAKE